MQTFAFLFGRIEPQREGQVIAGLQQINRVDYAVQVLGKFDFIARVSIESSAGPSLETIKQVTQINGLELTKILIAEN